VDKRNPRFLPLSAPIATTRTVLNALKAANYDDIIGDLSDAVVPSGWELLLLSEGNPPQFLEWERAFPTGTIRLGTADTFLDDFGKFIVLSL
jgi:hypothetical protein